MVCKIIINRKPRSVTNYHLFQVSDLFILALSSVYFRIFSSSEIFTKTSIYISSRFKSISKINIYKASYFPTKLRPKVNDRHRRIKENPISGPCINHRFPIHRGIQTNESSQSNQDSPSFLSVTEIKLIILHTPINQRIPPIPKQSNGLAITPQPASSTSQPRR